METTTDADLVQAAQAGDQRALAELVATHLPLVHNVAGRALPERADVDDVVQETMLRVVQRLGDLRDPTRFRAWLISITIRQIKDRMRVRQVTLRQQTPLAEYTETPDPETDVAADVVAHATHQAQRQDLLAAVRWLNPDERQVLALWWQELNGTLTRAELAEALGVTVAHAGVRIQRMKGQVLLARTVLQALRQPARCPGLTRAGAGWDGSADPYWFRKLARHVRACPACGALGAAQAPTEHHVVSIGLLAAPALPLSDLLAAGVAAPVAGKALAFLAAPLVTVFRRLAEYVVGKPAALVATPVVGAVAVLSTGLLLPSDGDEPLAQPPSPSVTAPAAGPSPATTASAPPASAPPTAVPTELFVAPDGDDTAAGTEAEPYATVHRAVAAARPGQTIYLRDGVHRATRPVEITTNGTAARRITLTNYPGERPTIDASGVPPGQPYITHRASHWTVRGLDVSGAPGEAYVCQSCRHTILRDLRIHANGGTGLTLRGRGTSDNQVLDSDFFDNADPARREADGLTFGVGSGRGNVVRGCRTFGNVDDGVVVDAFTDPVTIDATWSYGNGGRRAEAPEEPGSGHGFDLGDTAAAHVVTRSAAWKNHGHGFTDSGTGGAHRITRNTAFRNAGHGFAFASPSTVRDNVALGNDEQRVLVDGVDEAGNSWNGPGWGTQVLRDIDPATAEADRPAGGGLPETAYLTHTNDPDVGAPMNPPR
ncbi:hypothetical protein AWW66_14390 [Micromonospora rosaria]|uniref:Uncharacterized protein n=1 Tax=Micromonospora rosaria TaxID=47874 RepID=A0A136PS91_9ACTN|nr:sigma-70 family RNA polymerase sigma factor [Micromonospora rosaria]KXK61323.1 hypothetical protein AWW66_14390 [Micromonospora rosaria]